MKAHWRSLATLSLCIAAGLGGCSYDYKVNLFAIPDGTTKIEAIEWLRTTTRSDNADETISQSPNIFTYDVSNTDISLFTKNDSFSFLVSSAVPQESTTKRFTLELSVATFNSSSNLTSYGSISNQLNGTSSNVESLDIFLPPASTVIDNSGKTSGPVLLSASINKSLDQNPDQNKRCTAVININGWRFNSDATVSIESMPPQAMPPFPQGSVVISYRSATNLKIPVPQSLGPRLKLPPTSMHYLVVTNPGNASTDPKTSGSARMQIAGPGVIAPLDLSCM
jgi:hypothetical protein